jgi:antitoxin component of MazEF toxin-antitoxin module
MPLSKPITKHGNSAGIILEQTILKLVGWDIGTEVEIKVVNDSIVLNRHLPPQHNRRSTDKPPEK